MSSVALIILSPVFLIIAIFIKLDSEGPVIFKQQRYGIHKSIFTIYKFRTMYIDTPDDIPTHKFNNAGSYITRVGSFLRKSSLDELPQLLNILKGDMAIVGPRPIILNHKSLILKRDRYGANDVKPGLTGWAQINGRDLLTADQTAKFDGEYKQRMSFLFDCRCFFCSIYVVLKRKGVKDCQYQKATLKKVQAISKEM